MSGPFQEFPKTDAFDGFRLDVKLGLKRIFNLGRVRPGESKSETGDPAAWQASSLRFEHRDVLWFLLLLVPLLAVFFFWSWRKRRQLIAQFVQSRLLAHLTVGVSARRQKLRMALLVATAALLLIVLAQPQWGYHWEEARQRGLDVIVAIDTSRSMLAQDVAPNRLARAKFAALDLKKLARTDRVALIAFAGGAFLQSPLAFDDEAFRQNVNALDVNIIPQGGTAIAEAITTARAAFKEKNENYKVLVIFTDGEDHDGQALDAAKDAAKDGVRIFTVGVGTANGEMLRVADGKGRSDYIRDDQGNVVKSRLNEKLLQDIAQAGQGFYMLLTGANTIDLLYERGLAPLPKGELSARHVRRYHERYQWFLGAAILALLVEMFLPERKRVRRTEAIVSAGTNVELRKAVAALLVLTLPVIAFSAAKLDKETAEQRSALRGYERLLEKKPYNAHAHYNAGTSAFWLKEYDKAADHLNKALITDDLDLQQRTYYNLGHAHFRAGEEVQDPNTKTEQWENALRAFQNSANLNPQDEDAKYNVEVVKKKLEELKKQQEKQQDKKDDDKKDEKKDENKEQKQDQSDKKDQGKDQKQDQQKQDQQKQDQQEKPKEDQSKPQDSQEAKKPDEKKPDQQNAQKPGDKDDKSKEGQGASAMRPMQMTQQQAQQLLDAQKSDERALLFVPQLRTNRQQRVLKDW
jgi:Ca-activated chloride channel homolog